MAWSRGLVLCTLFAFGCGDAHRETPVQTVAGEPAEEVVPWLDAAGFAPALAEGVGFVDFYADNCAPCQEMEPIVADLAQELTDIGFFRVDTDAESALTEQHRIEALPTFILFVDGVPVGRREGAQEADALRAWIDEHR